MRETSPSSQHISVISAPVRSVLTMLSRTLSSLRRAVSQPAAKTVVVAIKSEKTKTEGIPWAGLPGLLGSVPPRIEPDPWVLESASIRQLNDTPKQAKNAVKTRLGRAISRPPTPTTTWPKPPPRSERASPLWVAKAPPPTPTARDVSARLAVIARNEDLTGVPHEPSSRRTSCRE